MTNFTDLYFLILIFDLIKKLGAFHWVPLLILIKKLVKNNEFYSVFIIAQ